MALPEPVPGLVIRYSYLWYDEAAAGAEEGRKDRPAVIVLALRRSSGGEITVLVAPVTHRSPDDTGTGIEIPAATKRRLGLDDAPSWIVADDLNQFVWPGPDLRAGADGVFAYGELPEALFLKLRGRVLASARSGGGRVTERTY